MTAMELYPGRIAPLGVGTIPFEVLAKHSGVELLRLMLAGEYPAPTMAATLNFALTEVSEGRVVFCGLPGANHLNPMGGVHGGWAATILDSALGCAVHSTLKADEAYTTVEFKVNLTRPIIPDTGEVVCEGKVVHRGRTLAVSEATLKDRNGRLLAMGTETCSIFPVGNLAPRG